MKISRRRLNRAAFFSAGYIIVSLLYVFFALQKEFHQVLEMSFFGLITALIIYFFLFLKKFLKRYYNYRDKHSVINTTIILFTLHNLMIFFFSTDVRRSSDWSFIYELLFIVITVLLMAFFIAMFSLLLKLSKKHFNLLKTVAWSFMFIPIVTFTTGLIITLKTSDILISIEQNYPAAILLALLIFPVLIMIIIYRQARNYKY